MASKTHQEFAEQVGEDFKRIMLEALPELAAAVERDGAQASYTATLQLKKAGSRKKGFRLEASLKPRVRAPIEPIEYDVHLTDRGQLALGIAPEVKRREKGNGKAGEEKTSKSSSSSTRAETPAPD